MEKTKFDVSLLDILLPRIDRKLKLRKEKGTTLEVIVPCLNRLSFEKDTSLNDTTKDNPYTTEYGKFKYKIYDDFYFPGNYDKYHRETIVFDNIKDIDGSHRSITMTVYYKAD
jgi:hypothetical protein